MGLRNTVNCSTGNRRRCRWRAGCVTEYRELQHRQSQNKAELLEVLSDEQKELLEKYCATEIELNGISEREAFAAGFKIAMRLAAEAFYESDCE